MTQELKVYRSGAGCSCKGSKLSGIFVPAKCTLNLGRTGNCLQAERGTQAEHATDQRGTKASLAPLSRGECPSLRDRWHGSSTVLAVGRSVGAAVLLHV